MERYPEASLALACVLSFLTVVLHATAVLFKPDTVDDIKRALDNLDGSTLLLCETKNSFCVFRVNETNQTNGGNTVQIPN